MENKGIEQPQSLVDGSTNGKIIDKLMTHNACFVDKELTPISNSIIFFKNLIGTRNRFIKIGDQRIFNAFDTSLFLGSIDPCCMSKVAIYRTANNFCPSFFKLGQFFLKS